MKNKHFTLLTVVIFSLSFFILGIFFSSYFWKGKNKAVEVPEIVKSTEKEILKFPFEYLPEGDWGGGTEEEASFSGELEARSYPTMEITLSQDMYSNSKSKSPSIEQIEEDGGDIKNAQYFDVDKDGKKEEILSYCTGNHCPDKQDIIKDGKVIFSMSYVGGGSLEKSVTGNGFYANWYADGDLSGGLCCPTGNTRTRFVYKNGIFVPVFEQKIEFVRVKNSK